MNVYRGDIYYVTSIYPNDTIGSEQRAGRPAIIVSNNKNNLHVSTVTVVYLTTQDKPPMPTHVPVICRVPSTALCEQIATVAQERLGDFVRTCTKAEMEAIDKALMIQLGIELPAAPEADAKAMEALRAELKKGNEAYEELDESRAAIAEECASEKLKRAALEAELNAEKAISDKYAQEIASLQASNDSLKKTLEEYRTTENFEIRKLKEALDAEKENSLLYKAQLDAQVAAVLKVELSPVELQQVIELQQENIRLKAQLDVYKQLLDRFLPVTA